MSEENETLKEQNKDYFEKKSENTIESLEKQLDKYLKGYD